MTGNFTLFLLSVLVAFHKSTVGSWKNNKVVSYITVLFLMMVWGLNAVLEIKRLYEMPIELQDSGETVVYQLLIKKSNIQDNPYVYIYLPVDGTLRLSEYTQDEYSLKYESGFERFNNIKLMHVNIDGQVANKSQFLWPEEDHFFALHNDLRHSNNGQLIYLYSDGRYLITYLTNEVLTLSEDDLLSGEKVFSLEGKLYERKVPSLATRFAEWLVEARSR
jgi:hypothetical protein